MATRMDNSVFHAVKDHQQIEKYNALNTSTIVIDDTNREGFDAGNDTALGRHNQFTIQFAENQSQHIKNAKIRLKFLGLPVATANTYGYGAVLWGGTKNGFRTSHDGGMGRVSDILTVFAAKEVIETDMTNQTITTGLQSETGPPALVGEHKVNTLSMPTFSVKSCIGEPVSDNWVYCDNPFGKSIQFTITEEDLVTPNADLGHSAGERVIMVLEVCLLPDNQANDKFSY